MNFVRPLLECEHIFRSDSLMIHRSNEALFDDDDFVEILARWRNENTEYFITQIPTNLIKTRAWLKANFTDDSSNILFIVFDRLENRAAGHIAISMQENHPASFVIHSVLRGEQSSVESLMQDALNETLRYCQHSLGGRIFFANCFETSKPALNLYKRLKFSERGFIYLIKTSVRGGHKWVKSDVNEDGCIRMYQLELIKDPQ